MHLAPLKASTEGSPQSFANHLFDGLVHLLDLDPFRDSSRVMASKLTTSPVEALGLLAARVAKRSLRVAGNPATPRFRRRGRPTGAEDRREPGSCNRATRR